MKNGLVPEEFSNVPTAWFAPQREDREISPDREVDVISPPTAEGQKWHWRNYLRKACPERSSDRESEAFARGKFYYFVLFDRRKANWQTNVFN